MFPEFYYFSRSLTVKNQITHQNIYPIYIIILQKFVFLGNFFSISAGIKLPSWHQAMRCFLLPKQMI